MNVDKYSIFYVVNLYSIFHVIKKYFIFYVNQSVFVLFCVVQHYLLCQSVFEFLRGQSVFDLLTWLIKEVSVVDLRWSSTIHWMYSCVLTCTIHFQVAFSPSLKSSRIVIPYMCFPLICTYSLLKDSASNDNTQDIVAMIFLLKDWTHSLQRKRSPEKYSKWLA